MVCILMQKINGVFHRYIFLRNLEKVQVLGAIYYLRILTFLCKGMYLFLEQMKERGYYFESMAHLTQNLP